MSVKKHTELAETKELSPMQVFALRSVNMPMIWENVISHLSVKDIANCLKVCTSVRRALEECMKANTKMCRKKNIAATVCAIAEGKIASKVELQFKRDRNDAKRALWSFIGCDKFCAIDGAWYHKNKETDHVDVLKLGQKHEKIFFKKSLIGDGGGHNSCLSVLPTADGKTVIVQSNWINYSTYLVRNNKNSAKLVGSFGEKVTHQNGKVWEPVCNELHHRCSIYGRPYCARYRLYEQRGKKTLALFMTLLNARGQAFRSVMLHKVRLRGKDTRILHIASNDEVKFDN